MCESAIVQFGRVITNIHLKENLIESIESQTNLKVFNGEVYCYKHVRADMSSIYDKKYIYKIGINKVDEYDSSSNSSAAGLHVSHASYWNYSEGEKVLFCKVKLEDIITVQEGKIRCKQLEVIGVCDGEAY